jgi:hypothetical protein
MKTLLLSAILALAASSTLAQSESATDIPRVEVPARALTIEVPAKPRYMMADDFKQFAGEYDLSNGDTLSLRRSGGLMYARIGKQDEHRIVATGRNAFVALDRQLKVRIDHNDDGTVGGELVMVVPAQKLADGSVTEERIASLAFPGQ